MRTLSYLAFRAIVFKFSLIPFSLLYFTSDFLAFLLFKVIRYRRKVIRKNLLFCFPTITKGEIEEIENKFFRNFTDILLESIKGYSSDVNTIAERHKLINPEILNKSFNNGENLVFLTQHYGNWEWGGYSAEKMIQHDIIVMYKNLSHPLINRYIKKIRSGKNITLVNDSRQLFKSLNINKTTPKLVIFVIDQYPANIKKAIKVNFFGRNISFNYSAFVIAEQISAQCNFVEIRRVKRGNYELEIKPLLSTSKSNTTNDALQSYAQHLEDIILKSPAQWMWTHKRFKDELNYS